MYGSTLPTRSKVIYNDMKNYILGLYEKSMPKDLSWSEKLKAAKECGFDYIEISIDETDEKLNRLYWTRDEKFQLKKEIHEAGLPIYSMCLSGHRKYPLGSKDEVIREKSLTIMKKAVDFAADLGIRIIQLAGYDVYYEDSDEATRTYFAINLKKVCEMAATKGVMLGFETMETPFMDTVEKAMYYVHDMNSVYLGVYPDIGNLTNSGHITGKSVAEDIKMGNGHIVAVHLKETKPGQYREVPFGMGHTEFIPCLEMCRELGVKMFVGEFWYTGSKEWKKDLEFANNFLRDKINKVYR